MPTATLRRTRSSVARLLVASAVLGSMLLLPATPANAGMSYRGMLQETAQTEMYHPYGLATDDIGNIYVADTSNHRVIKFGPNLEPIWIIGGTPGQEDGQLYYPEAVAFGNDTIYVADTGNHRVQAFTTGGDFILKWGKEGSADGDLLTPNGIAVNPCNGNVYVTEARNHRVSVFTANGQFNHKWGTEGSGGGQFEVPSGIAFGSPAMGCAVYVSDQYNHRVMIFDPALPNNNAIFAFGKFGSAEGELSFPDELAVDPVDGTVYVVESGSMRVSVWRKTTTGYFTYEYASTFHTGEGALGSPHGIAMDGENNLFVTNTNESDVYKFKDLPPKLDVDKLSSRGMTRNRGDFLFNARYNQADQTCETLGRLTVTAPARDVHVFRLEKGAVVDTHGVDMIFDLSDKQLEWIESAWNKDRKVTIEGRFVGLCSGDKKVINTHTWKA
ncbi:MAG: tripartite motif-containing protein 71 [Actinomycetota bacterium]|jgi:DNA-binding beta-propeller fold protein YncE|nr:tripartite motif-containing protein 71 [Actinomycetota bacterium]